jgi:hypothetical protein
MILTEDNFHLVKEEIKKLLLLNDWTESQIEEDYGYNGVSDLSGIICDSVSCKNKKHKGSYVYYTYEFNLNNTTKLITETFAYISDGSESHSHEVNFVEYIKD